jgi:hypothetical protein
MLLLFSFFILLYNPTNTRLLGACQVLLGACCLALAAWSFEPVALRVFQPFEELFTAGQVRPRQL